MQVLDKKELWWCCFSISPNVKIRNVIALVPRFCKKIAAFKQQAKSEHPNTSVKKGH